MKNILLLISCLCLHTAFCQVQVGLGGNYSQIHTVHHVEQVGLPIASYNEFEKSYYLNTYCLLNSQKAWSWGVQINSAFSRGNYAFQVIDPATIGYTYVVTANNVWQLEVAPTIRYSKNLSQNIYSFLQGQLAGNYSWNVKAVNQLKQKTTGINSTLAPGIGLHISKRLAIELQYGLLGYYNLFTSEIGPGFNHTHHLSFLNVDVSKNAFRLCLAASLGK